MRNRRGALPPLMNLKVPLDKATEPDNQRCILNVVSKDEKASTRSRSPESSMGSVSLSRPQFKAILLQPDGEMMAALSQPEVSRCKTPDDGVRKHNLTLSIKAIISKMKRMNEAYAISQSSIELNGPFVKSPNNGDCEWRPIKVVSSLNIPRAERRLPEAKADAFPPVSRPSDVWTSVSCSLSAGFEWQARWKPPNMTILARQYIYDIISAIITWRNGRPPKVRTGFVPILKHNLALVGLCCFPKDCLVLSRWSLHRTGLRRGKSTRWSVRCVYTHAHDSKELNAQALKPHSWAALRRLLNGVIDKIEMRQKTSCSPNRLTRTRLPFVLCCSHTALEIGSY